MNDRQRNQQHLLIVDDSEEDRARVRAALMQGAPTRRYIFEEVSNGEEALRICSDPERETIDCIIIDVHMPKVTGPDFLKRLCMDNEFPEFPVVVLTGSSLSADASQALQMGAQDYITKDAIFPSVLFRVIDNAIERHRLLSELHRSRIAADSANRAKSALIGNISHEIRTPMTAVLGLCELLLDGPLNEDQQNLLTMIRENGEYLVEIVNDLLDLSKLEAGGLAIDQTPVNLQMLLTRITDLMQVRAQENQTSLVLEVDENLPRSIRTDAIRFRQIVLNLVSNAVKFSPNGQVTIRVRTSPTEAEAKMLFVEIVDNGVGIPASDLERIFQPFFQSELKGRAKSIGGTGLGLAICRRLVSLLGGKLSVDSVEGKGSTFRFELPLIEVSDKSSTSQTTHTTPAPRVVELPSNCEFLLAEDTRATQVLISRIVEAVGGQITVVDNGDDLVSNFVSSPDRFRLILTDVHMPGLDGLEATRRLRDSGCQLPILVLTADANNETRSDAERAGATGILTKPIDRQVFLATLARYCNERQDCET